MGNVTIEVNREKQLEESIWVVIGSKKKIRLGLIYAPQESRTKKEDLKKMYKRMKEEIKEAKEKNQKVIIMGDLNCKVGKKIEGNIEEITKGGRMLLDLLENEKLNLVNTSEKCEGKWTRQIKESYSIIHYIIIQRLRISHKI